MATVASQIASEETALRERRRAAMAVLAASDAAEVARHLTAVGPLPAHEDIRAGESGMVMVRGRIGGDGAPFNLGEATVSRAAVRLATGETGIGYVLGRDRAHARLIAMCDALVQTDSHAGAVERHVLAPIRARLDAARRVDAERVAATKVEFFTLVRGEG
ncbi:MAG TPA: phosphonate C-P lyase system protein PhnG [Xanthobacteraceae bacterium]|nr:phosphonate C-P lyase system protein PhnG [Xanthobacteraceae bacterium]